jgi:hypothetical protein
MAVSTYALQYTHITRTRMLGDSNAGIEDEPKVSAKNWFYSLFPWPRNIIQQYYYMKKYIIYLCLQNNIIVVLREIM